MSGNEAAWRLPEDMGAAELLRKLAGDLLLGDAALYDYLGYGHEGFWGAEKGGVSICRTLESLADMVERELLLVELCGLLGIAPMGLIDVSRQELAREFGKRVMPEGMEWPRFDDGEPVRFGDDAAAAGQSGKVCRITFCSAGDSGDGTSFVVAVERDDMLFYSPPKPVSERVKRPAPKVLDADGVEIRVGDTVYDMVGDRHEVKGFGKQGDVLLEFHNDESLGWRPSNFTHRAPVLAADGKRIKEGMDVWWVCSDDGTSLHAERMRVDNVLADGLVACHPSIGGTKAELPGSELYVEKPLLAADGKPLHEGETVYKLDDDRPYTLKRFDGDRVHINAGGGAFDIWTIPSNLTHEQPDSWKRLEEDCGMFASEYAEKFDLNKEAGGWGVPVRRDLVRRAKKLAGVER